VEGGRALRLGPERLPALDRDGDGRLSRDEFPGAPATRAFVLGTDYQGRDLLVRVLYGVRLSLLVGVAAAGLSFLLGVCWGGAAGFLGGLAGRAMMRGVDVLYAVPFLFVIVILVVLLGPGTGNLLLAIALVQWMPLARVFRGEVARLKGTDLYSAGRLLGLSGPRILFRHLLPNALTPVLPFGTLLVPAAILDEAFLSFLGLGVRPPTPSIGIAIVDGVHGVGSNAFSLAAPALALALILIGFYRLGDVLRRKL
jgi:oligopeptide transport system permease protein